MKLAGGSYLKPCDGSNSEASSSDDEEDGCLSRTRRGLSHGSFAHALKSSRLQSSAVNSFDHWNNGNPSYRNLMLLFSRTGYHLKITTDGKVFGTQDESDPFAIMEINSAGLPGHVTIKGKESKLYIAMNKKGRLYGEVDKNRQETIWLEELIGSYNTYMSRSYAHLGWFLAIKKSGKPKRGLKTGWGQKATQFLPRRF